MYTLINQNITQLLATVEQGDIDEYLWMIQELQNRDVTHDQEFHTRYCSYWALNGAGLGQGFRNEYFSILEQAKRSPENASVDGITRKLYEIPTNSLEKKALQFSFASKLVHMVRTELPVYDRMVETFYYLPRSYAGTAEKKLENLLLSFGFLVKEYDRILRQGLLDQALHSFRRRFSLPPQYSDQKSIDTLIWKFVPFLEKGALRDGSVIYG
jgi:hypothetical protein